MECSSTTVQRTSLTRRSSPSPTSSGSMTVSSMSTTSAIPGTTKSSSEHASRVRPVLKFAVCLDGANACPPEDCGGTSGYEELLEVLADPTHEAYKHYSSWAGRDFDPTKFDLAQVNAALQRLG